MEEWNSDLYNRLQLIGVRVLEEIAVAEGFNLECGTKNLSFYVGSCNVKLCSENVKLVWWN